MPKKIIGFSKLSREEKIDWLSEKIFDDSNQVKSILDNYLNSNKDIQAIHDSFSENSISNFYLPYSLSPNFLINNKNTIVFAFQANLYCVLICKLLSIKVIIRSNSAPEGWSKNLIKRYLYKLIINLADKVMVNSFDFKKTFRTFFIYFFQQG